MSETKKARRILLKGGLLLAIASLTLVGCGDTVKDAFFTKEVERPSSIVIQKNTLSVITLPSTGVSISPPKYDDINGSATLEPSSVQFSVIQYPTHGDLLFTGNLAVYKPNHNFIGADYYSFDIYDQYEDTLTIYKNTLTIQDAPSIPKFTGSLPAQATVGQQYIYQQA